MHPTFFIVPLIVLIPISIFAYVYLGNMCHFFGADKNTWKVRLIVITILCVMIFFSHSFFSKGFIGVVHVIAIALIMMGINYIYRKVTRRKRSEGTTEWDSNLWQKIYGCHLVPIVLGFVIMAYGVYNMHNIVQKDYTVETDKNLNQQYKIAMIADIHMGTTMNVNELENVIDRIKANNPDLVVLCGDIFDESTSKEYMEKTCELIGSINPKYGIYYVYGNHDAAQFIWEPDYTAEEMEKSLINAGITILKDQSKVVNNDFYIVGRKDAAYLEADRLSSRELLSDMSKNKFILMLDHQPTTFEESSDAGVDLLLSGHTHAGQIWPIGIFAEAFGYSDLNEGYEKIGEMQAIVSSGLGGFGTDVRTESHSAYEIITLK